MSEAAKEPLQASRVVDRQEIIRIITAEYAYWRDGESEEDEREGMVEIRIGAMAAASNILAAVLLGHDWRWGTRPPAPSTHNLQPTTDHPQ
jgi:hypothetical protein